MPFVLAVRTLAQGANFTLETDLGDIDLIGDLASLGPFSTIAGDAIALPVFGGRYLVASLDAVIRSKKAAGRPKDLQSLPELEALKELQLSQAKKRGKK